MPQTEKIFVHMYLIKELYPECMETFYNIEWKKPPS